MMGLTIIHQIDLIHNKTHADAPGLQGTSSFRQTLRNQKWLNTWMTYVTSERPIEIKTSFA